MVMEHQELNNICWMISKQTHPYFRNIRFKKLHSGYHRFIIDTSFIDEVDNENFNSIEDDRVAFFIGSQFGISPQIDKIPDFFNGEKLVAILSKSLLSGNVYGLVIYQMLEGDKSFNDFSSRKVCILR
jgi:hypothetical protein